MNTSFKLDFFFSSRRRHTRWTGDWSSDVCSSDLGAQRSTITSMFVRQGLMLTAGGIACGLVLAFAASRLLQSLLFHVSPADPVTYAVASLGLCAAAWLASYIPSRRTATVNPVDALRAE